MIVALLGVLKSGAAYVPLDPAYPLQRLQWMVTDTSIKRVLCSPQTAGLAEEAGAEALIVETDGEAFEDGSEANPQTEVTADNLAYVIYTSGSTGRPKGVMIEHRAIANRLLWMMHTYPLDAADRLLQKTTFSFDASVWEIFVPLMSGARLVLAEPGGQADTAYLADVIQRREVTVLQMVPSMLSVMMKEEPEKLRGLKRVYSGGEALTREVVREVREKVGVRVVNLYGPTEASIDATTWESEEVSGRVYIGRAISNVRVYVLDDRKRAVGVGVRGEIYIGGAGVSRGYMGRAELTAERFEPEVYSEEMGRRMYRTGDIGRYDEEGRVEYLGREDEQVKVRGYRIEKGEIEGELVRVKGVKRGVVEVRGEGEERRLVGYVEAEEGVEGKRIREELKRRVPEYMVPSKVVVMERLPVLPNGKIDRKSLIAFDYAPGGEGHDYVAPTTPTQEIMADIWAEILATPRVGIRSSFFDLGGHSLLAMQLITRIRQVFQVDLSIRNLFDFPSVEGLSEKVEQSKGSSRILLNAPIELADRSERLPLSFAQQRLWFLAQLEPESPAYNLPMAIRLNGPLNLYAMQRTLDAILQRHEVLTTSFDEVDGQPVQVVNRHESLNMPLVDLMSLPSDEREGEMLRLAVEEARKPFDFSRGPLLRATLIRLAREEYVVLFTMHHIASDGWSVSVLVEEVGALYEDFSHGRPPALPRLPVQYADYAVWQRKWLQGALLDAQLEYWKNQLGGRLPRLELPPDRPRVVMQTFRGAHKTLKLPKSLREELEELSRREGVTLFMTLLAAFKTLLYRYTGQEDILVGTPIANRNRAELEGLIGFFANTLVLRTSLSGNPSFSDLLRKVREVAVGAYIHQDLPFEKLVEALQPERTFSNNPLFQVCFDFQNSSVTTLNLKDLTLSPVEISGETAKFELVLNMWTSDDGLMGTFEYSTELFDSARIEQMMRYFTNILEEVAAHPGRPLLDIPLHGAQRKSAVGAPAALPAGDQAEHFDFQL